MLLIVIEISGAMARVINAQKGHLVAKGNKGCRLFVAGPEVGMRLCSDSRLSRYYLLSTT